jgi:hypothetical protein
VGKKYGRLTSDVDIQKGTEYGGVDGMIQPPPHSVANVPREGLLQAYQTNPSVGVAYRDGSIESDDQPIPETKKIK